jgi:antirestriction protein ArdC
MTYKQASEMGAQVKKGARGSLVVYADRIRKTETTDTGEEVEQEIPFMKGYTVFNAEQIDGLPPHLTAAPSPAPPVFERIASAEQFTARTSADIRHGGNRAYYAIDADRVQLPPFESFRDAEGYYATLLHELTHWTRHGTRLAREFGRKRWGDAGYAAEELVGVTPEPRDDHASYIASWLEVLKNDKRAIFTAASHAQRAADYLHGLQQQEDGMGAAA